ncbi:hypothetical protein MNV_1950004 [Candidatus Methanoperedens nitroreducens]|uniref:Uncharacterized protein n=1 Tax=Candidatus Methanoperedens nitratireducens TaxID=1392998 RepID=A0A284VMX9_9EURY|nr:hypothetical protein MNV_1950004 [Candidatus Methanoperedens nitroreducens]
MDRARAIYNFLFVYYNVIKNFNGIVIFKKVEISSSYIVANAFDTNLPVLMAVNLTLKFGISGRP